MTTNTVDILTIAASCAAMILSQLPPIKQLLRGKKLRLAVADRAQISHVFGNTNLTLWIDLENIGGRALTVRSIRCYLLRDAIPIQPLAAKTYIITESLGKEKPVTLIMPTISLRINDSWSGYIQPYDNRAWTTDIEHRVKKVTRGIQEDVNAKVIARDAAAKRDPDAPIQDEGSVDADQRIVADLTDIKNSLKRLEHGNYSLLIAAYEYPDNKPLNVVGFEFTLYEEDIMEIFDNVDDWKHGYGIQLAARKNGLTWVGMVSKRDTDAVSMYRDLPRDMTKPYQGGSGFIVLPR